MFSGTISCVGHVMALKSPDKSGSGGANLKINVGKINLGVAVGNVLNFSGVCLRLLTIEDGTLSVYIPERMLNISNIASWEVGHAVNIGLPLCFGSMVDGHLIYGCVDCIGIVVACKKSDNGYVFSIMVPDEILCYIAINGCLAVDGAAVFVSMMSDNTISLFIDEHMFSNTAFSYYVIGSRVNIEVDMVARYLINYVMLK